MLGSVDLRVGLPLQFDCSFRPWSYRVSHRTLVLRSHNREGGDIDVVFVDVLGMKIKALYRGLTISDSGRVAEIDEFVDVPERHRSRYVNLSVSDRDDGGFVVCGALRIEAVENT
ncbi:hypothetical protein CS0771_59890 [Catellatospora sp. IY07-71]|uniref:hypothetical protein n=1 Tax=Catellatospora sp. IY07-71 TaxID=2728827 RepID=UPI001BB3B064|nr:hypothetical protein [Catellatospora sp. IY07-71]BCJ76445.1 hypothetical protein CS0771_59890 [Catellatospora sp. IY07-71]